MKVKNYLYLINAFIITVYDEVSGIFASKKFKIFGMS